MLEKALELLNKLNDAGYEAYLVGGFVRDYLLKRNSSDIDICTNATPMEIKNIFKEVKLPFEGYGSVHLIYKKINFEITTYRMDLEYKNGRTPSKIMYTNSLIIDLKRRDFVMNTLCMDKNGNIIDLLGATNDINNRIIRSIGNPKLKLTEDALRILRAIRFATELNFKLDDELKNTILEYGYLLENLSYYRKKQELNKIFSSVNKLYGIELLRSLNLDKYLKIDLDKEIVNTNDPIGIWVQVNPCEKYQFTNNEKTYIDAILRVLKDKRINNMELYKNGSYVCYIAAEILNIPTKDIYDRYDMLQIKNKSEIAIKPVDIINILNLEDKSKLKIIINDIENKIVNNTLLNEKTLLNKYLIDTYKNSMI